MSKEQICGNCKWHSYDGEDWVCICPTSYDNNGGYTGYNDSCEDYEER